MIKECYDEPAYPHNLTNAFAARTNEEKINARCWLNQISSDTGCLHMRLRIKQIMYIKTYQSYSTASRLTLISNEVENSLK